MTPLRRYILTGHTYFVTVVTYKRHKILLKNPDLFHNSWKKIIPSAWVILPDHFHAILEVGDFSISDILHSFKITYSRQFRDQHGPGRVWQNRFWDHVIRDEEDLNRRLDYIHYNPVRHGVVDSPMKYGLSSLSRFVEEGLYEREWANEDRPEFSGEFGE